MQSKCYLQGKKADRVRKIDRKKAPKSQLMWSQRSDSFFFAARVSVSANLVKILLV